MNVEAGTIKLTDLASCGGCAAKYSAARLEELLRGFVPVEAENLLVGLAPADDAAVYKLDDERALIFTLDFFPPVVDDPADYGAIAATNALNDVFAMGGTPLLALSIAAFPESCRSRCSPRSSPPPTRRCARPAACSRAATRSATRSRSTGSRSSAPSARTGSGTKNGARPGDALYVTKPLGTGLIMTGYRSGLAGDAAARARGPLDAHAERTTRPRSCARCVRNAVTDVTGFGLFGHAYEMADRSGVRIVLESERFPAIDGALDLARKGVRTSGDPRNREFVAGRVEIGADVPETLAALGYDPQTAGGLLVSIPAERGPTLEAEFEAAKLFVRRVGMVEEGAGVLVR